MNDFESIRRLIALYGQLLDSKRFEDWGDLFTPNARFLVWGRIHEGREAILREIGGIQPDIPGKHLVLQPVIDLEDARHAHCWTDLCALATIGKEIRVATIGRYHDRLVKADDDGRWRFTERALVMGGEAVPDGVLPIPSC